jgi:hypothetical protein
MDGGQRVDRRDGDRTRTEGQNEKAAGAGARAAREAHETPGKQPYVLPSGEGNTPRVARSRGSACVMHGLK